MDFDSVIELSRNSHLNWSHTSFTGTNCMTTSISQAISQAEFFDDDCDSPPLSPVMTVSQSSSPAPGTTTHWRALSPEPIGTWGSGSRTRQRIQGLKEIPSFNCAQCPKKYTRSSTLREHARTHTNERPFLCTVCKKTFVRLKDRNRHENLHSGEKKFVCKGDFDSPESAWGCGRKFAREDALVAHFRNRLGVACNFLLPEDLAQDLLKDMRGVMDYPLVCKDIPKYTGNLKMWVNGSKVDMDFRV